MKDERKRRICPVERAKILDRVWRKLLQNPARILRPHVKEGMTALDLGCGPGFFTAEMAGLVGESGRVIAADLQQGMLDMAKRKLADDGTSGRVRFHLCASDRIGLSEACDFVLAFYMLHEVPEPAGFLREIHSLLKPEGRVLLAEPKWHVGRDRFRESIELMKRTGFAVLSEPRIRFSRTVLLAAAGPKPG
jgi:ubiquinone/menaquinone biosynthesis C-methylase UbiE